MPMNTTLVRRSAVPAASCRARSAPGRRSPRSRGRARSRARRSRRTGSRRRSRPGCEMHSVVRSRRVAARRIAHEHRLDGPAVVEAVERLLGQPAVGRTHLGVRRGCRARNASARRPRSAAGSVWISSKVVARPTRRGRRPGVARKPARPARRARRRAPRSARPDTRGGGRRRAGARAGGSRNGTGRPTRAWATGSRMEPQCYPARPMTAGGGVASARCVSRSASQPGRPRTSSAPLMRPCRPAGPRRAAAARPPVTRPSPVCCQPRPRRGSRATRPAAPAAVRARPRAR